MDDNNDTPVNIFVSETPTVKDQIVSTAIGIGATLVAYGAIVGGVAVYQKVQEIREKKAAAKLSLVETD